MPGFDYFGKGHEPQDEHHDGGQPLDCSHQTPGVKLIGKHPAQKVQGHGGNSQGQGHVAEVALVACDVVDQNAEAEVDYHPIAEDGCGQADVVAPEAGVSAEDGEDSRTAAGRAECGLCHLLYAPRFRLRRALSETVARRGAYLAVGEPDDGLEAKIVGKFKPVLGYHFCMTEAYECQSVLVAKDVEHLSFGWGGADFGFDFHGGGTDEEFPRAVRLDENLGVLHGLDAALSAAGVVGVGGSESVVATLGGADGAHLVAIAFVVLKDELLAGFSFHPVELQRIPLGGTGFSYLKLGTTFSAKSFIELTMRS